MKNQLFVVSFLFLSAETLSVNASSQTNAPLQDSIKPPQEITTVDRVIDGTTLVLENRERITLAFVAVPTLLGDKAIRGNEHRINLANAKLSELVLGKGVLIKPLNKGLDRYGNMVAQVFLTSEPDVSDDGWLDVGAVLLKEGLVALRHTPKPSRMWAWYIDIEDAARALRLGIWNSRALAPACEAEAKFKASRYAIIAGDVEAVSVQREVIYINFTNNWREDFTVRIAGRGRKALFENLKDILEPGSWVEVRGWISWINGPMIDLTSLTQIQALEGRPSFCVSSSP